MIGGDVITFTLTRQNGKQQSLTEFCGEFIQGCKMDNDRERWFCHACNEHYYRDDSKDHQYCNLTDKELREKITELEDRIFDLGERVSKLEN